uniref:Peptidase A1 domain-containing protein n=1 Tax=Brugia timori TaxID=42155 RepID=A0A0R3QB46_9BILA
LITIKQLHFILRWSMAMSLKIVKKYSDKIRVGEIFPHIPLSTLRLLNDSSSIVGLNYQIGTEFRFLAGPTYAIVGFRKFVVLQKRCYEVISIC